MFQKRLRTTVLPIIIYLFIYTSGRICTPCANVTWFRWFFLPQYCDRCYLSLIVLFISKYPPYPSNPATFLWAIRVREMVFLNFIWHLLSVCSYSRLKCKKKMRITYHKRCCAIRISFDYFTFCTQLEWKLDKLKKPLE